MYLYSVKYTGEPFGHAIHSSGFINYLCVGALVDQLEVFPAHALLATKQTRKTRRSLLAKFEKALRMRLSISPGVR
jgi:hypothetical protein